MLLSAHPNPQPNRHIDRFSHFCTAHCSVVWHARACPSPNIASSHGESGPHLIIRGSLSPPGSTTQTASRSVQPFLQLGITTVTDRPTDLTTRSVAIGRIYVRSTRWGLIIAKSVCSVGRLLVCRSHRRKRQQSKWVWRRRKDTQKMHEQQPYWHRQSAPLSSLINVTIIFYRPV